MRNMNFNKRAPEAGMVLEICKGYPGACHNFVAIICLQPLPALLKKASL